MQGAEADRLAKVAEVVRSPLALDTSRGVPGQPSSGVQLWRSPRSGIRTMPELDICDALDRCSTMPDDLEADDVAHAEILFRHDVRLLTERLDRLPRTGHLVRRDHRPQLSGRTREAAYRLSRCRGPDRSRRRSARRALRCTGRRRVALRSHRNPRDRADPFPERDGDFNGSPSDDQEAVAELERLCRTDVRKLVVWQDAFWVLDLFVGFRQQLRSTFPVLAETPEVIIFDLVPTPDRTPAEPVSTGVTG